jgi:hypothetical protein
LQLPRTDLDRRVIILIVLVDGQIGHTHIVLLGRVRLVGQAHRIAIVFDPMRAAALRRHGFRNFDFRNFGFRNFLLEAYVFAAADSQICLA